MIKKLFSASLVAPVAVLATIVVAGTVTAAEIAPKQVVYADGAVSSSLSGMAGDVEQGRKVMTTRGLGNCIACHEVSALKSVPFHGEVGPTLDGAADRWSESELRGIVANAKMTFEETVMPSFYKVDGYIRPGDKFTGKAAKTAELPPLLNAQQIEDVVAYLLTLKE
ncbi:MAG: sulfur oxidation c-type cytochrome SoxX [Hyphomicrobiales bacterium]|nr:MAG: sulfur oxidation c-type cytochrome SoxX [Hyphomicrobiales bacterium]